MKKTYALIGLLVAAVATVLLTTGSAQAACQSICVPSQQDATAAANSLAGAIASGNSAAIATALLAFFSLFFGVTP